ncbi:MAG: SufS family cysteine desulfurase [Candidatus Micrarchaeota archaeon]|nr:SufS family cysteine desulfurase [Candidatus Micrarchaeota archaeon]
MNGKPLVYLDSAATSQKPIQVIDAVSDYYKGYNANIHRGIYKIAEKATEDYIGSKGDLAKLVGAGSYREIVYVRNATEAINVVALSYGSANVGKGDRILISKMEHHSNIVPWQMLAKRKGAILDYIEIEDGARIDMSDYKEKLEKEPKIVSFTHASNVLGTINNAKKMTQMAHSAGAAVLVDGAQSAPHLPINLKDIGCDFFVLSGHKMLAPSGIGALIAKEDILEKMEPVYGGGDMIRTVSFEKSTWNELPWKFEAGTQNIEGGIGMGAAARYLLKLGMENVRAHERAITEYALKRLEELEYVTVYGPGIKDIVSRVGVVAFKIDGVHSHDAAAVFDSEGIAIRSGHHCAMPLVREIIDETSVSRMSFYIYNRDDEVDSAIDAIGLAKEKFGRAPR